MTQVSENTVLVQGDLILRKIAALPEGLTLAEDKILAYGEATGHAHMFAGESAQRVLKYKDSIGTRAVENDGFYSGQYIVVDALADLTHGKHTREGRVSESDHISIQVPPGIYRVDLVSEFDYDSMEARAVVD